MSAILNRGDLVGTANVARTGVRLGWDQEGKFGWTYPMPYPHGGVWQAYEPGAIGQNGNFASVVSGTGAARNQTASSVGGRVQAIGSLNTGTTTTGRAASSFQASAEVFCFDTTSAEIVYEAIFRIPVLPDGTETFGIAIGFLDVMNNVNQTDGAYLLLTTADTEFQAVTSSNSTRTTTDTGITASGGQWYHIRIVVTNVTNVKFYIGTHDVATTTEPTIVATNTTNIPTGTSRRTGAGISIVKTAGTTARTLEYSYQFCYRRPIRTSVGVFHSGFGTLGGYADGGTGFSGAAGMVVGTELIGGAYICKPVERLPSDAIPFLISQYGMHAKEFTAVTTGSGAAVNDSQFEGWSGSLTLATGTTAAGVSQLVLNSFPTIAVDNDSGKFVYEAVFSIPTISTGTQTFTCDFGFLGSDGIFFRVDPSTNVLKAITTNNETATSTDTSITITADAVYWIRIVIEKDDTVTFSAAAIGSELEASNITHTTNIPPDNTTPGMQITKSVGTTSRNLRAITQLCYQRRDKA